jgi:hypothetical protein
MPTFRGTCCPHAADSTETLVPINRDAECHIPRSRSLFFSGVGLSPLGTAATSGLLYNSQMIDVGDCGAIGGIKFGRGNRNARRKPAPAPLRPPQKPQSSCLS